MKFQRREKMKGEDFSCEFLKGKAGPSRGICKAMEDFDG